MVDSEEDAKTSSSKQSTKPSGSQKSIDTTGAEASTSKDQREDGNIEEKELEIDQHNIHEKDPSGIIPEGSPEHQEIKDGQSLQGKDSKGLQDKDSKSFEDKDSKSLQGKDSQSKDKGLEGKDSKDKKHKKKSSSKDHVRIQEEEDETLTDMIADFYNKITSNPYRLEVVKSIVVFVIAIKLARECKNMLIPMRYYTPFRV